MTPGLIERLEAAGEHTPGPWTAHLNFRGQNGSPDVWQIDDEHDAVCTTQFCYAQNTEANARLIAAAPDLLEAAQKLVGWAVDDPEAPPEFVADVETARAAILKARATQEQG